MGCRGGDSLSWQWEATAAEAATLAEQLRTVQSQLEAAHTERARLQELVEAPTEQGAWEVQARLDATLLQLSQLQVRASPASCSITMMRWIDRHCRGLPPPSFPRDCRRRRALSKRGDGTACFRWTGN